MAAIKSSGDGTLSPAPLFPSICLPSCPSRCPSPPNCFSPTTIAPSRICAGTRPVSMLAVWGGGVPAADVHHLRPRPAPVPRENSEPLAPSDLSSDSSPFHHLLTYPLQLSTRARYLACLSRATPLVFSRAWSLFFPSPSSPLECPLWDVEAVL